MPKLFTLWMLPWLLALHAYAADQGMAEPAIVYTTLSGHGPLDKGHAIAANEDGEVYQVGLEFNPSGLFFICKYTSEGELAWRRGFPEAPHSSGYGVACAEDGVIGVGNARVNGNDSDGLIAKFDTEGNMLWRTFLGGDGLDIIRSVAIDHEQNIIVGGATWGAMQGLDDANGDASDGFVAKLTPEGELIWIIRLGSYGQDECKDVAVDIDGTIYAGGETKSDISGNNRNIQGGYVAQISPDGVIQWTRQWDKSTVGWVRSVAACPDGGVFVAMRAAVAKLDAAGEELWRAPVSVFPEHMSSSKAVHDVMADGEGGVFYAVVARVRLGWGTIIGRIDADGETVWLHNWNSSNYERSGGICTNGTDRVYLGGETRDAADRMSDAFVVSFEVEGIRLQRPQRERPTPERETPPPPGPTPPQPEPGPDEV